jgi:hypothetical protein
MATTYKTDAERIRDYRENALARREKSSLNTENDSAAEGITIKNGAVTITLSPDAKPISELGGVMKVFGPSRK